MSYRSADRISESGSVNYELSIASSSKANKPNPLSSSSRMPIDNNISSSQSRSLSETIKKLAGLKDIYVKSQFRILKIDDIDHAFIVDFELMACWDNDISSDDNDWPIGNNTNINNNNQY